MHTPRRRISQQPIKIPSNGRFADTLASERPRKTRDTHRLNEAEKKCAYGSLSKTSGKKICRNIEAKIGLISEETPLRLLRQDRPWAR